MPQYTAYTELQLIQLQQELNAIICITDTSGMTKLFCDAGRRCCMKEGLRAGEAW